MGENDFRKSFSPFSTCLAVTENIIFRKMTSGLPIFSPLTRKSFSPLIFTSNNFRKKREREREREKREPRSERERERRESPDHAAAPTIAPRRRAARSTQRDRRSRCAIYEIARRDRRSRGAIDEIARRDRRSTGAIDERARRTRIARRRSSEERARRTRIARRLHFFCWVLVSFA